MSETININQFAQTPAIGQAALSIVRQGGALAMQISDNESGTLYAGGRVKLDPAITSPMPFPQVITCADDDKAAIGIISLTVQRSSFTKGMIVEVSGNFGPVSYQQAAATIAPGAIVERASGKVQTLASGAACGIALDPAVLNGLLRVVSITPLQVQA